MMLAANQLRKTVFRNVNGRPAEGRMVQGFAQWTTMHHVKGWFVNWEEEQTGGSSEMGGS